MPKLPVVRIPSQENLKIKPRKACAGGPSAVLSSLVHTHREIGLWKGTKALLELNQKNGFDCPGCAWPDPDDERSIVEFCENGVKAVAEEATAYRVTPEFFSKWPVTELIKQSDFWLGQQGRLTHPMYKKDGSDFYESISWEKAFEIISLELTALTSPDQAVFYTSGRTSNEAAFVYQLFVRAFGTNNLPDCSNMCHESSGTALNETIGIGKGTVTLKDLELADCILVQGQNPGTNHPRMLSALQKAVRNGCKIISINPLPEAGLVRFKNPQQISGWLGNGTPLAQLHLPVKINGDVALLKGIMKVMLEELDYRGDRSFIEESTLGYNQFVEDLKETSWNSILDSSGLSKEQIEEGAKILVASKRVIACWAMGLTQHENAVANIQEVVNLLLLGGHLGREGSGVCPVRGHSNVQGDRTMGIWEKPPRSFLKALEDQYGFVPPPHHGYDTVESIEAMSQGKVGVFFAMGGNFASATPDPQLTHLGLSKCALTVHVSTKLNKSHAATGKAALILPCLGRTEQDIGGTDNRARQFVTTENSMGVIQRSEGRMPPASSLLKSEVRIVCELADRIFKDRFSKIPWKDFSSNYGVIRDHIAKVIPGFEGYNKKIDKDQLFTLPNPVRDQRKFNTQSGKAIFTVHKIPKNDLASDEYFLMTIRSHDQYNTTIYGLDDRYRGIFGGRQVIFMNEEDISIAGLNPEKKVDIISSNGRVNHYRIVPYSIPRGCVATYFPETNALVSVKEKAHKSGTPIYKSIRVKLQISQSLA